MTVTPPLMEIHGLTKTFPVAQSLLSRWRGQPQKAVQALTDVELTVRRGETLGIVGESGCGKSTLARTLVRLYDADRGSVRYSDLDVLALSGDALRQYNRRVQMIFQDPYSSLNPRMTVEAVLREALSVHKMRPAAEQPARVRELLALVGLPPEAAGRLPHEFSGGQRQRIGIARALALEPECLIADELVSGSGRQPAAGTPGTPGPDGVVRGPRFAAGAPHLAPGGGDVPGPRGGGVGHADDFHHSAPSIHAGAAGRRSHA
ncbi:dipeptide/oligopeptide/nickel ABC transporter ATP-binding protein [Deinococcus arenicola]|uniref:Dipeptide/oligopeptide/nickel ABC transporter ATP-binding protein n=1 Tax=Deinococcus arenicola TaxID=2994950 RepID=A0ABU4DSP2_9DEIO|nr:dipeptide/oligopeptide/nickel ABC transporter ATP-binding protein [Deinococcus sp. ZS9-10]MDV6375453.1 dipeptide/oligopeptide/nickel ABC transporter ATP-binding protein [Deinococcus sp. ZS9-10]